MALRHLAAEASLASTVASRLFGAFAASSAGAASMSACASGTSAVPETVPLLLGKQQQWTLAPHPANCTCSAHRAHSSSAMPAPLDSRSIEVGGHCRSVCVILLDVRHPAWALPAVERGGTCCMHASFDHVAVPLTLSPCPQPPSPPPPLHPTHAGPAGSATAPWLCRRQEGGAAGGVVIRIAKGAGARRYRHTRHA